MRAVGTRIETALRAGARAIRLETAEEDRALEALEAVAQRLGWPLHVWSEAAGVDHARHQPLLELLHQLRTRSDDELWVLLEPGPGLEASSTRRALRELAQRERGPAVVLVEPPATDATRRAPIPELLDERLPPPGLAELGEHLEWAAGIIDEHHPEAEPLAPHAASLARAALGLPRQAVDRLLAEAVLLHGGSAPAVRRYIAAHKPATLDREGMLEPCAPVSEQELGGLDELKTWLRRRALALRPRARLAAIPPPRGVLLLGVQGCGKSLAARVCAELLGLPLVRLEPGRLFGGTVGQSEANLRRTLALVERLAPVVLWLDEIDKGLAGSEGAASDAGTAARVVGGLLTWLQEREQPVFVAATANRVDALPPELLRRGRLDEIFFVDLPGAAQREAILRVHLEHVPRRTLGQVPPMEDEPEAFAAVIREAEGWSGAEIEAALVEARLDAFAEQRPLCAEDLRRAVRATVPLSRARAESIAALRAWASERARRA
ncbi:MAG: AAA family ATPase [Myxococcales bacterium]|nr:AAA family ATPase [Myxococcales bacterium]MCB9716362.1 AAA family ATPase [Myxococcales bacterium]